MTLYEILTLLTQVATAFLIAGSVIFAALQIRTSIKISKQTHEWNRRIATQSRLTSPPPTELVNKHTKYIDSNQPIDLNELLKIIDEVPELSNQIQRLLNYYESIARGIRWGIYDEKMAKEAKMNTMRRVYLRFSQYIQYRRNHIQRPTMYHEGEELIKKWLKEEAAVVAKERIEDVE